MSIKRPSSSLAEVSPSKRIAIVEKQTISTQLPQDPLFILHPLLIGDFIDQPTSAEIKVLSQYTGRAEEVCELLFTLVLTTSKKTITDEFEAKYGKDTESRSEEETGLYHSFVAINV